MRNYRGLNRGGSRSIENWIFLKQILKVEFIRCFDV